MERTTLRAAINITVLLYLTDDPRDRVLTSDAGSPTRLAAAAPNGCVIVGLLTGGARTSPSGPGVVPGRFPAFGSAAR